MLCALCRQCEGPYARSLVTLHKNGNERAYNRPVIEDDVCNINEWSYGHNVI